ncbi:hypothetical protein K493DRAFT_370402 [Basidiobolus meristosporus CBS 931.73]|uniref:Nitrite reductase [NAD(P)H] n=1 Tax=Basidiobolus meristosporus CBS 931.73 TaxID=1314790 RepID=A0A1Y1YG31_9FUNG|nr:hypothetical protein K493DRAFT_370402 [Basidiobolus meristosporus CBS 931.73]|eukprot:ORX96947.1 hypothetical protein K493DRAFT_370402 [Basidiobolus meristosporus CBS 931.73]
MAPNTEIITPTDAQQTIVVVGLGMVAVSFIEKVLSYDTKHMYNIKVFGEEPEVAYNRVGLTQYFAHRDPAKQLMKPREWYAENNIEVHLGDLVQEIDTVGQRVRAEKYGWVNYDICVLATGSSAALPPGVPPMGSVGGIYVYRTLEDLEQIIAWANRDNVKRATIVGGGLLGLEAAKAAKDLGLISTVYERADHLMTRQLDCEASKLLVGELERMGLNSILGDCPMSLAQAVDELEPSKKKISGFTTASGKEVETDMIIYSIGIRPRDQLARESDGSLKLGERGGIAVDNQLRTSAPNVYAIGECANFNGMCYGLVAPCYDTAEAVARNITTHLNEPEEKKVTFKGSDMSTKLKLMGVNVASFGNPFPDETIHQPLVYRDPFSRVYKKYNFTKDGKHLVGGMMVGDTKDYTKVLAMTRSSKAIDCDPSELILGTQSEEAGAGTDALPDDAQICSCLNVTKGDIRKAIKEKNCANVNQVKAFTKAGTGCGGCVPQVTEIFESEMKSLGKTVSNSLCAHFKFSRAELYTIVKVKELKTFEEVARNSAVDPATAGCEVCKPAIASIMTSLWNEHILSGGLASLQETNDRYLANLQRGGLYSVVPRMAGGEITPEGLQAIADVTKEYNLYSKITGAQRFDLFGARKEDLPKIWERLVDAGFESGHAYGKSLRNVKSCVGSTWCRYGQQDSVGFAIRLENRYKGIRSPHKLKGGVSGCIRECAEAQGKDFGLIATEKGYNVYVGGNGGTKPRHADLLVSSVSEEEATKYIDRYLMYYIMTADKLQRTARWMEKLPGGVKYLRKVIMDDHLGICADLDKQMQYLIGTYQCEWRTVVKNPELKKQFEEFVNTKESSGPLIEMIEQRGAKRPADWPKVVPALPSLKRQTGTMEWVKAGSVDQFPLDQGKVMLVGDSQIAVFHTSDDKWYAAQNMCPVKRDLVLSGGILGFHESESGAESYISCPIHKKNFNLKSGACINDEAFHIECFHVKVEHDQVYVQLPPADILDEALSTKKHMITKSMTALSATNGSMDW